LTSEHERFIERFSRAQITPTNAKQPENHERRDPRGDCGVWITEHLLRVSRCLVPAPEPQTEQTPPTEHVETPGVEIVLAAVCDPVLEIVSRGVVLAGLHRADPQVRVPTRDVLLEICADGDRKAAFEAA
jgi:hypothetical protein